MYKAFTTVQGHKVKVHASDSYTNGIKKRAAEEMKARIRGEMPIELVHLLPVLTLRKFPCNLPPFHTHKIASDPVVTFLKYLHVMDKAYEKGFLSPKEMIHLLLELSSYTSDAEDYDPELRSSLHILKEKVYKAYTERVTSYEEI